MSKPSFSIYNASAGSGKTYSLVKEYLKIILSAKKNDAYRNILAITFTNKAVQEMKNRIVGNLSAFTQEDPDKKTLDLMHSIAADIHLSVIEIKEKSKQIIKHIIHNYAAFDILTIDKFTHRVIRTFAHDLQLPLSFEVSLDTENLLTEAVDSLISQAGEDPVLTKLLVDFTMEKTDDDKSWDISREILDVGKLLLNENYREEITVFKSKLIEDFTTIKNKIFESKKELENTNSHIGEQILYLITSHQIDEKSFSRGTFPNHVRSIRDKKFNSKNKTFHTPEDISINKSAKDRSIIEELIPEMLNQLKTAYKNFSKIEFYNALLKNMTPLSLLNRVSQEFSAIQKDQNILSIAEFNTIIHNEIQNQPAPFIYERLGEKYLHFFIDEFQDTSQMQWQNLIPLIDNALAGENLQGGKGTLMIVGDPKQSIYRWRGGKAEQFIDLSNEINPFSNKDKQVVNLEKNFRSYSQIIDFNNQFFKFISETFTEEKYKDLYQNNSWQQSNDKIGGYVNISFIPKVKKEEDSDEEENLEKADLYLIKTLDTILQAKKNGFDYSEIVIIVRRNKDGVLIANYLTEQNIPIQSSETLLLINSSDVKIIIETLKYLDNSSDLEAKVLVLQHIASTIQDKMPVHDFIAEGMGFRDEKDFENWLHQHNIQLSFASIRKKTLYEATEIIIKVLLKQKYNGYIQFLLDIVLERASKYQSGISDFLNYWNKNSKKISIPTPENTQSVRIISIHKSKGLEFPVVIFPFADENYSIQPKDKLWIDLEDDSIDLEKVLVDNKKAVEQYSDSASEVYSQKTQELLLDNINVLYVALTRAEEQLYIITQYQELNKNGEYPDTLATYFINFLKSLHVYEDSKLVYEFNNSEKKSANKPPTTLPKTINVSNDVLNFNAIKIAKREALMWSSHQQEAIEYGNIIHEILSLIHTPKDIENAINQSINNGLIASNTKEDIYKTLIKIVSHPDLVEYFSDANQIWNEKTILNKHSNTSKPDRIVITQKKEVFLLDYKTGVHHSKYKIQLQNYTEAIESMGFVVTKKALVYIGENIEVVNI